MIGANFEARPNVVVDIASQFVKSRNAGVLRTGSAAIRSAVALADEVIAPGPGQAGLDPAMIQLIRVPGQDAARALVSQPGLIPLVILRGSGDSTRALAAEAARHGVRTMAHADGGAVLYLDAGRRRGPGRAARSSASLDRLGVCNRLNLLLVHPARWDVAAAADHRAAGPAGHRRLAAPARPPARLRVGAGLRARGHRHHRARRRPARRGHDRQRRRPPAWPPRSSPPTRRRRPSSSVAYAGTGAFWNATTRLLDGFKLLSVPETGINIDAVPGPRGPVTFRDLYLRQYVVTPV